MIQGVAAARFRNGRVATNNELKNKTAGAGNHRDDWTRFELGKEMKVGLGKLHPAKNSARD